MSHDPLRFISSLSAKLATRTRHVCFLFGAGTSRAAGLPDISLLTERILVALPAPDRAVVEPILAIDGLEATLSRLRALATILRPGQQLDGMTAEDALRIDHAICQAIAGELKAETADLVPARKFAAWLRRSRYAAPVEIFTVNYDLLFETAFDRHSVQYFDGFAGVIRARFQTELVETSGSAQDEFVPSHVSRLWKLHGSLNWIWDGGEIVRLGQAAAADDVAAIYPSEAKYDQSRRFPYVVLQDRFRRALNQPETLLLVAGYAFGDQHLNEVIFDALARHERTELIAFNFGSLPDELAARALAMPNMQLIGDEEAVLGGDRAPWASDENSRFWDGSRMTLCDFRALADYFGQATSTAPNTDSAVVELLAAIAAAQGAPK